MKVLFGQTLIDIAIQELGSSIAVYDLAAINGLSITDELEAGQELELPGVENQTIVDYYKNKNIQPATSRAQAVEASGVPVSLLGVSSIEQNNVLKAITGQTLFDIAIQSTGSAQAAFEMALLNSIGMTDDIVPGAVILPAGIMNKQIAAYYEDKKIKPATWIVSSLDGIRIFDYTFDFSFN